MPKKKKQFRASPNHHHFRIRCIERLGFQLSDREVEDMIHQVRTGKTIGERLTNSRSLHRLTVRGLEARFVYSNAQGLFVTVLPLEE